MLQCPRQKSEITFIALFLHIRIRQNKEPPTGKADFGFENSKLSGRAKDPVFFILIGTNKWEKKSVINYIT